MQISWFKQLGAFLSQKKAKKWLVFLIVFVLLGTMLIFLLLQAWWDSGTTDEVAHIPAGYSYVKKLDYRLNPEHPPLAKALAGVPLLFMKLKGPFEDWSWQAANQWEAGWNFLYEQGNDADKILFWSRSPIALLTIVLGLVLFFWVKSLYGRKVALFILLLYSFAPTVLAHGHLVTTDIAATLGFAIGVWGWVNFLERRTWQNLILAGVLFGIAQTLKFSCFLLIPILFFILIARVFIEKHHQRWPFFKVLLGRYLLVLGIGFVVVWLVYLPFVWNMKPAVEHQVIEANLRPDDPRTLPIRNFLHHFESSRLTRPIGHYLLGLFYIFGRTAGGNDTFILGHYSNHGVKWYFPVAWLLKIPLPLTVLIFLGLYLLVRRKLESKDWWRLSYIFIPLVIYWMVTIKGSLNIGIRHLLPTFPFVYLLAAETVYPFFKKDTTRFSQPALVFGQILVVCLGVWYIVSSWLAFPYYLAYFNEIAWGKEKHDFLVDSNLDWGQDCKRLARFVEERNIKKIKIDYFGGAVPSYYIPAYKIVKWHSDQGPATGWFAISATYFQFSKMYGIKEGKWDYNWLEPFKTEKIIGGSILVFNITPADLKAHPPRPLAGEIKIAPQQAEAERRRGEVQGWQVP